MPRRKANSKAPKNFKWSSDKEDKLIDYFERNIILYNRNSKWYRDTDKKMDVIVKIGERLGVPYEHVHKHITSLRTQHGKARRAAADLKSGSGAADCKLSKREAFLLGRLSFLVPYSRTRSTRSSLDLEDLEQEVNQHEQEPEAEDNSYKDEDSGSDSDPGSDVENEDEQVEEGGDDEGDGSSGNEDAESITPSDREETIMQEYAGNDTKKVHQSFDTDTEQEEGNAKEHPSGDTSEFSSSSSPVRPLLSPLQSQTGDDSSHENMQNLDNSIHSVDSEIAAMQSRIGNTVSPHKRHARSGNKAGNIEYNKASAKQSKVTRSNSSRSIRNEAKDTPSEENNLKRKKGKKKEESKRKSSEILNEASVSENDEKSSSTANERRESASSTKAKALIEKRKAKDFVKHPPKEITADDYFIDVSDDSDDLEARRNRAPTPPPDVLQKRKGTEMKNVAKEKSSKPTHLPQPNLYPPKQRDRKRKTVAQVAEERAQEVSEMNKRRVTALESIGNGLSIVSKRRVTGEMPKSAPVKKPVAIATHALSKESLDDEDEVSMWGRILMKNIRELDSNIVREDLMDHMMSLVRQAKRGSWPNQYTTPPRTQFTNFCHAMTSPLIHRSPITPQTPARPQRDCLGATASGTIANHPRAITPPVTANVPHLPEQQHQQLPQQQHQQHLSHQHQQQQHHYHQQWQQSHQQQHQQQQPQQQQPQQHQQKLHPYQQQQYKLHHQQQQYQQQGHQQQQSMQSPQQLQQETDQPAQQMMNIHHALPQPLNTDTNSPNGPYQQNVQGPCTQGNTTYTEGQPQYTTL